LKEVYIWLFVVRILHAMLLITGLFRFFGVLHDMLTWWMLLVNGCTIAILLVSENSSGNGKFLDAHFRGSIVLHSYFIFHTRFILVHYIYNGTP